MTSFLDAIPAIYHQKCSPTFINNLVTYVDEHRNIGGHFFTAVITNDLTDALGYADAQARESLKSYVDLVFNCAPDICWGSRAKVDAWCSLRPSQNDVTDVKDLTHG